VFNDDMFNLRKVVYPYLFRVKDRSRIRIDWEHEELRWIKPENLDNYETMPKLSETLARVLLEQDDDAECRSQDKVR
jgi:hypothetical protein